MDADQVVRTLGIKAEDEVVVHETAEVLWRDIEKSAELVTLLQDDVFASRLNAHLQGHIVRRLGTPEFVDASYGHIGEMVATLRGKGESYAIFHGGGLPGVDHRGPTDDLDAALGAIGWRALSNDEMRVLYSAPNLVRC
jgi:hypothetical protein